MHEQAAPDPTYHASRKVGWWWHQRGSAVMLGSVGTSPAGGLRLDICENGVKRVTWGMAPPKADRDFFAAHTVRELSGWSDYDLEAVARLAEPMSYDPATDHTCRSPGRTRSPWSATPSRVGQPGPGGILCVGAAEQRGDVPLPAVGPRVRHEQLAGLLQHVPRGERPGADGGARLGKGTVRSGDWEQADAIWLIADNAATNAPRRSVSTSPTLVDARSSINESSTGRAARRSTPS